MWYVIIKWVTIKKKVYCRYFHSKSIISVNLTISQQQLHLPIKYSKYICKGDFQGIVVSENSYC